LFAVAVGVGLGLKQRRMLS